MSRGKLRTVPEVCADCGAPDPTWASINRGLLICDECCSVHRSLGRHISQVRSLKKGAWPPTQLAMVHALYTAGANSIWEHTLLDPSHSKSGRRKPSPKDNLHPVKADFIRAKHQNLAFVHRPGKDESLPLESDLSKQLHSSVRTGNLETSLRLLAQGADPNYMHPEKSNTPLHMAAKAGQTSQVELLVVYGADPAACDKEGKTPIDYSREAGYKDLADRLVECQYEVTDRLAYYLCGRKPDHITQHFILPEMSDCLDLSEFAKAAKKKLQALPNNLFEELAMDVYDEVDRRENDAIWLSTQNQSALVTDRQIVPFLPVNPEFSSTRNQGRQKLARFNAREFATLIIDILCEAKRRQCGSQVNSCISKDIKQLDHSKAVIHASSCSSELKENVSDDEPLYDSVASDEEANETPDQKVNEENHRVMNRASVTSDGPITLQNYLELKKKLATSEATIGQLLQSNKTMRQEINALQAMVHRLMQENAQLRTFMQSEARPLVPNGFEPSIRRSPQPPLPPSGCGDTMANKSPKGSPRSSQRPQSMYEPRERHNYHWAAGGSSAFSSVWMLPRDDSGIGQTHSSQSSRNSGEYDNTSSPISHSSSCQQSRSNSLSPPTETPPPAPSLLTEIPTHQEVIRKTEQITKRIQELLISAQEGKHDSFVPCTEKIYNAVVEMASIFPQAIPEESIRMALKQLLDSALRLQRECKSLLCSQPPPADHRFITQQVIQCAYDVAKAAKQLVTLFPPPT